MLPEGWKRVPLHKIADVRTGLAKGRQGLKDVLELPYLRVANVQDGHIDLREVKTIQVGRADIDRYALLAGDVLMTEGGDFDKLGRGAVWCGEIAPCLHQNHVFAVRPNADYLDSSFLSALSGSEYGRNYFLSCAKRSTNLASINSSQLKTFPVLLPRLDEQKRISEVLAIWDAAIATTDNFLANSRRQKQILAIRLLRAKAHWVNSVFGEVFEISNQKAAQVAANAYQVRGSVPIVDQGKQFITGYTDDDSVVVEPPIIVFGDHTRVVKWVDFRFRPGADGTQLLQPKADIYPKFAYHLLANAPIQNLGYSRHMSILKTLDFPIPPDQAEQSSIADRLDLADQVIAAIELQIEKLKTEKRALMQQLLTGKRRVHLPIGKVSA